MSEKELLSKETFINLLGLNEIDRIEKEDELYVEAKRLGIEKRFKESLKKYQALLKDKIKIEGDVNLPKCKYDIDGFNFGSYTCDIHGITDKSNHKFSYIPVIPVERYVNAVSGKEKVKIIFYKEKEWKELIVDKSQLSISQKLLMLSDDGLDVTSENVRYYINYFNEIMNINDINTLETISHIGWRGNLFIPYDAHGIFDGADDFKNIYRAISSKGNYDKWKEVIQELRKNKYVKLIMATALSGVLIEKLNIPTFIVNVWSSMSGSGKTLTCMCAMSVWGNPEVGGLTLSSNCTQNYYTTIASFMRNYTCYFDELQIVKNSKVIDFESLIMDLCNGTEKGRLNKNSQAREVKTWRNNFLFTNNDRMVNENAGEQIYNRVIDLEIRDKIVDANGQDIARVIKENYGFAGKEYIKYIQNIGFDAIFSRFKKLFAEIVQNTKATDKQANSLACLLLANQLANECIFKDEELLTIADIEEYINDKDEVRTAIKARNYIVNVINANYKKFEGTGYGEVWGEKSEFGCTINAEILYRELKKGGFEFNTIKRDWVELNFLMTNSQGRYIHQTTAHKERGNYIKLNLYYE